MVQPMGPHDRAKRRDAEERADGQSAVHQAVVEEQVEGAEERHPVAHPELHVAQPSRRPARPEDDEGDRDRRVERAEHVVALETAGARRVVGAMDPPQRTVPEAPVQERRPEVHRRGDGDRDRAFEQRVQHHGALPMRKPRRKRTQRRASRSPERTSWTATTSRPRRRAPTRARA
jgi:hypothetical protein